MLPPRCPERKWEGRERRGRLRILGIKPEGSTTYSSPGQGEALVARRAVGAVRKRLVRDLVALVLVAEQRRPLIAEAFVLRVRTWGERERESERMRWAYRATLKWNGWQIRMEGGRRRTRFEALPKQLPMVDETLVRRVRKARSLVCVGNGLKTN